jgi:uncharacterized protein with PQ loop repeat
MYEYLMNTASALYFACYLPELYANYKNKNANFYNFPEKAVIFLGSTFAFAYSVLNNDIALMTNYGPILALDTLALLMRGYYVYKTKTNNKSAVVASESIPSQDSETELTKVEEEDTVEYRLE